LVRLNINDLTRTDSVVSKRVRVRQVDIGGVLQVAIGNSTMGEIENENRFLRRQLEDLSARQDNLTQQISDFQAAMKQAIAALRKNDDDLRNNLNACNQNLVSLTNRLMHSASPDPSSTCLGHTTSSEKCSRGWSVYCLHDHDIRCPAGRFLTRLHFVDEGDASGHYEFTCCSAI